MPLRIGWLAATVGLGGADANMFSIIRAAPPGVCWAGVVVEDGPNRALTPEQVVRAHRQLLGIPLHVSTNPRGVLVKLPNVYWHQSSCEAVKEILPHCDVVISWAYAGITQLIDHILAHDVLHVHWVQNTDHGSRKLVNTMLKGHAHGYILCCSHLRTWIPQSWWDSCVVIPNSADPARATPALPPQHVKAMLQVPSHAKVMLFVGRLVDEKQPQRVVSALRHLPDDWHAVICGTGHDYILREITTMARDIGGDRVHLVPWVDTPGTLYQIADAVVVPSDFEGMPLVALEAMLAGCHVVATELPYVQDLTTPYGLPLATLPVRPSPQQIAEAVQQPNPDRIAMARQLMWERHNPHYLARQLVEWLLAMHSRWIHTTASGLVRRDIPNDEPLREWS